MISPLPKEYAGISIEVAQQLAPLWQGEVLEVRGERIDHLQVWDHVRERGGFVDAARVKKTTLAAAEAPELLALVRFVRETPGSEALGIGIAAAYLKAAPADALLAGAGAETFDAIGTMADRLAQRASAGSAALAGAVPGNVCVTTPTVARFALRFSLTSSG